MKLGIIGTSGIAHQFAKGALEAGFTVTAVLSRDKARGEEFMSRYGGGAVFTDIDTFAASDAFEVGYVASPNSLHFPQSLALIDGGKHVLVEKPCYMTSQELETVLASAAGKNVLVLETLRAFYSPATAAVRENLANIAPIRHVYFNFMKYSSKYDSYKRGENPTAFDPNVGGGSLGDLGVYLVYACLDLFGIPKNVSCNGVLLESGSDAVTDTLLSYDGFSCVLSCSKISDSHIPSEIQGENGSILINHSFLRSAIYLVSDEKRQLILDAADLNDMKIQQSALLEILMTRDNAALSRAYDFMRNSVKILETCRSCLGA